MPSTCEIARYTECLVRDCDLGSASIFFVDRRAGDQRLSYIHHTGVSDEAQHVYATRGVFLSDPFGRAGDAPEGFTRWGEPRLDPLVNDARDYRSFLAHYEIDVVGAWRRSLAGDLSLIIGAHRRGRAGRFDDVPLALLTQRLNALSGMVVDHLFETMLASAAGQIALHAALPVATGGGAETARLSERENEIAALICQGKQNKQVAWMLNLSEFTIENHLRRMYRKLGIHSRAALVAHFTRRVH